MPGDEAQLRPNWDSWALGVATAVAARADCTRRQVGAVIVGAGHRVVSTGYNGTAPGRQGCLAGGCPRGHLPYEVVPAGAPYDNPGEAYCIATHAEMNALIYAPPSSLDSATMYVTCEPCKPCWKVVSNTPIRRIVFPGDDGLVQVRLVLAERFNTR